MLRKLTQICLPSRGGAKTLARAEPVPDTSWHLLVAALVAAELVPDMSWQMRVRGLPAVPLARYIQSI